MNYLEIKQRQEIELNAFPMFFAFSDKQFKEGVEKLGASPENKLIKLPGGGFILKKDMQKFEDMLDKFDRQMKDAMKDRDFLCDAIGYELNNHEYSYTGNAKPALDVLGITLKNEFHRECFEIAEKQAWRER